MFPLFNSITILCVLNKLTYAIRIFQISNPVTKIKSRNKVEVLGALSSLPLLLKERQGIWRRLYSAVSIGLWNLTAYFKPKVKTISVYSFFKELESNVSLYWGFTECALV